jgi:hypothetical protein
LGLGRKAAARRLAAEVGFRRHLWLGIAGVRCPGGDPARLLPCAIPRARPLLGCRDPAGTRAGAMSLDVLRRSLARCAITRAFLLFFEEDV